MAAGTSAFSGAYNSFSGVDVRAVFNEKTIAEIQAISYSISREKAPVYTMGSADPRSFSRGKRGIAGTLIFIVFDRHALLGSLGAMAGATSTAPRFLANNADLRPGFYGGSEIQAANQLVSPSGRTPATPAAEQTASDMGSVGGDHTAALAWYADQIPPFDITVAAVNEYGAMAVLRVYGVEILNEGFGISVDDIQAAEQFTYVARQVIGWQPLGTHVAFLPPTSTP